MNASKRNCTLIVLLSILPFKLFRVLALLTKILPFLPLLQQTPTSCCSRRIRRFLLSVLRWYLLGDVLLKLTAGSDNSTAYSLSSFLALHLLTFPPSKVLCHDLKWVGFGPLVCKLFFFTSIFFIKLPERYMERTSVQFPTMNHV